MNANNMGKIKYLINSLPKHELQDCVEQAFKANTGKETREIYSQYLDAKGLGGFIRAGK